MWRNLRLPSLRKRALLVSNTTASSQQPSTLHSSAHRHLSLLPRRWWCLCSLSPSLLGLSLSPSSLLVLPSCFGRIHRACRSLAVAALTRSQIARHAPPTTPLPFTPRLPPTRTNSTVLAAAPLLAARCLTYSLRIQSSAVDLPLSVRQVLHLRHCVLPVLCPAVKKRRPATLSPCPSAVNSRTVFTLANALSRSHVPSTHTTTVPRLRPMSL